MAQFLSIEAIVPNRPIFDTKKFQAKLKQTLQTTGAEVKADYEKTTRTWKTEVNFQVRVEKEVLSVEVDRRSKGGEIYTYVDKGTRPHIIRPRRAKTLRFRVGGSSKTKVRRIQSFIGSPGSEWRSSDEVHHPGTEPREFSKVLLKKYAPIVTRRVNALLKEAAEGS